MNFKKFDVILNMSMLINNFIVLNSTTTNWRFNIKNFKLILKTSKNFAKNFQKKFVVFVLICANVNKLTSNQFQILKIFKQIKNFESIFDNKIIEILINDKNVHYVINLIKKNRRLCFCTICFKKINEIATLYWKCFNQKIN